MNLSLCNNLPELFFEKSKNNSSKQHLIFINKENNKKESYSWQQTEKEVLALSNILQEQKVQKGERVMLVSENRPEWLISDVAIMSNGGITVPNYTTYAIKDFEHIIQDSKPVGLVVSSKILLDKIISASNNLNYSFNFIIHLDKIENNYSNQNLISYNSEVKFSTQKKHFFFDKENLIRKDPACIIYTSGTEGNPKGVILSHGGILSNCDGALDLLEDIKAKKHTFLTWLPLSHSYEHTIQFVQIALGAKVFYAESLEKLLLNIKEAKPTIMTAVPRFYNNFYNKIKLNTKKIQGLKKLMFNKTIELGEKLMLHKNITNVEKIINYFLDILVRRKIKKNLGGNIKAFISGGGPLDPQVGLFLNALGLKTMQGYGLTEASPVVSCNPVNFIKVETVGKVLKNTQVKIAEDGEILVSGENIMLGYWNNEEATKNTIINDWLHTGDIGEIDADGYLKITDRKKDIIVNSGGDNISPAKIENLLCANPEIDQALIFGDNKNYLVALIFINKEFNLSRAEIGMIIDNVNKELAAIEKVKNFHILDEGFTLENNMLTPTMKMKRYVIVKKFFDVLNNFYNSK
jgi:long-chain acyl-CoA synthetase